MSSTSAPAETASSRRWLALGPIAATQFMVIMETSIVGVAPPEMQADLGFPPRKITICSLHVSPWPRQGRPARTRPNPRPLPRYRGIPPGGTLLWIDTQEVST